MTDCADLEVEVRLPATTDALDGVHAALERFFAGCRARGAAEPGVEIALATAVAEVAANVVRHSGAADFALRLRLHARDVEAELTDRGGPFVEPAAAPDALPEGGMGLAIARGAVDRLAYAREAGVNRWTLVKRREGA